MALLKQFSWLSIFYYYLKPDVGDCSLGLGEAHAYETWHVMVEMIRNLINVVCHCLLLGSTHVSFVLQNEWGSAVIHVINVTVGFLIIRPRYTSFVLKSEWEVVLYIYLCNFYQLILWILALLALDRVVWRYMRAYNCIKSIYEISLGSTYRHDKKTLTWQLRHLKLILFFSILFYIIFCR